MSEIANIGWEWTCACRAVRDRLSCPQIPAEMAQLAEAAVAVVERGIGGPTPVDVACIHAVELVGAMLVPEDGAVETVWRWALEPILGREWPGEEPVQR